jgi:hypothetical protein
VDGNYLLWAIHSVLEARVGAFSSKAKFKLTHFLSPRPFDFRFCCTSSLFPWRRADLPRHTLFRKLSKINGQRFVSNHRWNGTLLFMCALIRGHLSATLLNVPRFHKKLRSTVGIRNSDRCSRCGLAIS